MASLTHIDEAGSIKMVDVSSKEETLRRARASGVVSMKPETLRLILDHKVSKGNVFEVARIAGIQAAKKTGELIPLCHPLGIDSVRISIEAVGDSSLSIRSEVAVIGRTGVEMEAMTAVAIAALTIYDMCKSVDRSMSLGCIVLEEKEGGRSGHWVRSD